MDREVRSPEDLEIDMLIAELVDLHEPKSSEKYARLARAIAGRTILNLNGVFKGYSRTARTSALAMIFTIVESSPVESLLLQHNRIDGDSLASALDNSKSGAGHWKVLRLKTLDLSDNSIRCHELTEPGGGFASIAKAMQAGSLSSLLSLSLSSIGMDSHDMRHFASVLQHVPKLQTLCIEGNNIIDAIGMEALASSLGKGCAPALQELRLSTIGVLTSFGFKALAGAFKTGNVTNLKILYLDGVGSRTSKAFHLALVDAMKAGSLPALEELRLPRCNVDSNSCEAYAQVIRSRLLPKLKVLDFSRNYSIGSEAIESVAEAINWGEGCSCKEINLSNSKIGSEDVGVVVLTVASFQGTGIAHVTKLLLSDTRFGTDRLTFGIASAVRCGNLKSLEVLDVSGNGFVGMEAMLALAGSFESGQLPRLRELRLGARTIAENEGLLGIARAVQLGNLKSLEVLDLSRNSIIGNEGVLAIAASLESAQLPQLREVRLGGTTMKSPLEGIARAAALGHLNALEVLDLSRNSSTENNGLLELAVSFESGQLPRLRELRLGRSKELRLEGTREVHLGGTRVEDPLVGIARAADLGHLNSLEVLDLSRNNSIGNQGLIALAASFHSGQLPRLKELRLGGTRVEDEGVVSIARGAAWGRLNSLEVLDLSRNYSIGNQGVFALAASLEFGQLPRLRELHLGGTGVEDEGLLSIARAVALGHLKSLKVLDLSRNSPAENQGDVLGLTASIESGQLTGLRKWRLGGTGVEDEGLVGIARAVRLGHLKSLEVLDLSRNSSIGNQGVLALADSFRSGQLTRLRRLLLRDTSVDDEGLLGIAKAFLSGHIHSLQLVDLRGTLCTHVIKISSADEKDQTTFNSKLLLSEGRQQMLRNLDHGEGKQKVLSLQETFTSPVDDHIGKNVVNGWSAPVDSHSAGGSNNKCGAALAMEPESWGSNSSKRRPQEPLCCTSFICVILQGIFGGFLPRPGEF